MMAPFRFLSVFGTLLCQFRPFEDFTGGNQCYSGALIWILEPCLCNYMLEHRQPESCTSCQVGEFSCFTAPQKVPTAMPGSKTAHGGCVGRVNQGMSGTLPPHFGNGSGLPFSVVFPQQQPIKRAPQQHDAPHIKGFC